MWSSLCTKLVRTRGCVAPSVWLAYRCEAWPRVAKAQNFGAQAPCGVCVRIVVLIVDLAGMRLVSPQCFL